ncbi:MAG TPA: hypothetical protein VM513_13100 [Kofleriaceae bacterium]|jgi:hypothetical protein|nr:hypothetical protein [Kofleriaceae bacterium]
MKRNLSTNASLLALMIAAATGCAAQAPGPITGDDDVNQPDDDDLPVPLTPEGRFTVQSDFDLATNLPGTAGTVANYFINATDDPEDPSKFIIEQLVNALPDGSIKNTLNGSIPFVAGYVNDKVRALTPEFVDKIIDLGDAFGQVTHHFGTNEILEITAGGRGTKTINGLHLVIDNVPLDIAFTDHGIQPITVANVQVALDQAGRLTVQPHVVPMKYGALVKLALEQAVIPMVDPSASTLEDALKNVVNCQAVGQWVYEAVDIGSASTFESACNTGLHLAPQALYGYLDSLDTSALEFNLTGTARGVDRNGDSKMDEIQTGVWTGEVKYSGSPAPLSTAKFHGSKAI